MSKRPTPPPLENGQSVKRKREENGPITAEFIESLKKDALYRELLATRYELDHEAKRKNDYEKELETVRETQATWAKFWKEYTTDLAALAETIGPTTPATSHSQAFLAINETPAPTECQQTKDMIKFLVAHISESKTQTKELLESYKPVDKLTAAVHNASVSLAGVERDFSLLREKNKSVSMQYDAMRIQNVILTRKINRLNSEVASSLTVQRPKEPEEVEVKEAPQVDAEQFQVLKTQITTLEEQAKIQTKHSEDAHKKYHDASREIDQLREKLVSFPRSAEYIVSHSEYLRVKNQLNNLQSEAESHTTAVTALAEEVKVLTETKLQYKEGLWTNSESASEKSDLEMKKIEADLNRIRKDRDRQRQKYQSELAVRQVKESDREDLINTIASNKKRIEFLLLDVNRLQAKLNANSGEQLEFFDLLKHEDGDKSLVEQLAKSLKNAESRLQEVLAGDTKAAAAAEVRRLTQKIKQMEEKSIKRSEGSEDEVMSMLEAELEKLHSRIQYFEANETKTLSQIEAMTNALTDLEVKYANQTAAASERDGQIVKLLAEKTKIEQKMEIIVKEKDSYNNKAMALEKTSKRQQEHLTKLEAMHKTNALQIAQLEKKNLLITEEARTHSDKAKEYKTLYDDIVNVKNEEHTKLKELRAIFDTRRAAFEESERSRRQMEKQQAELRRDLEAHKQFKTSGTPDAELDQLKLLIRCSACNLRFKNTIIMKCCHVFCKECLDMRISTRQRKCPNCSDPFGVGDVKPIYL